jgi:monovalent cation:H+ antiporter-2, CPA2 family
MGTHVLLNLGGAVSTVLQSVQTYRTGRYRDIEPTRFESLISTNLNEAIEGLDGDWHAIAQGSKIVGSTIAQANIRQQTGATIMAIRRGRKLLRYPDPQTVLTAGDRLLLVGDVKEQASFERLFG